MGAKTKRRRSPPAPTLGTAKGSRGSRPALRAQVDAPPLHEVDWFLRVPFRSRSMLGGALSPESLSAAMSTLADSRMITELR